MRASITTSITHKALGTCRVWADEDLFLVVEVFLEEGSIQLRLFGSQVAEVERAIKKLKIAKNQFKDVSSAHG